QPCMVVLLGNLHQKFGQLKSANVPGKLGALQPRVHLQHLDRGVITIAPATRRIDRYQILPSRHRRQPDLQLSVTPSLHRARRGPKAASRPPPSQRPNRRSQENSSPHPPQIPGAPTPESSHALSADNRSATASVRAALEARFPLRSENPLEPHLPDSALPSTT